MNRRTAIAAIALALPLVLATALLPAGVRAQEAEDAPPPPPLALESLTIEPAAPGPETLCQLRVKIANEGEKAATAFGFDVTVSGQRLPVYDNQLFLKVVPAGETVELALYNFWTSETGRPAPADGKMAVEVTLREARWVKVGDEKGVEVWDLQDEIGGLPVSTKTVVTLKK